MRGHDCESFGQNVPVYHSGKSHNALGKKTLQRNLNAMQFS